MNHPIRKHSQNVRTSWLWRWGLNNLNRRDWSDAQRALPTDRPVLVVVTPSCSPAEAPRFLLKLLKAWRLNHDVHMVLIAMNSGELESEFRAVSDAFIASPGRPSDITRRTRKVLGQKLPKWTAEREVRALICSAVAGELAGVFQNAGVPVTALVHEFADAVNEAAKLALYHNAQRIIFPSRRARTSFRRSFAQLPTSPLGLPELDVLPPDDDSHALAPCEADKHLRADLGREAAEAVWGAYAERVWSAVNNDKRGAHRFCKYADVKTVLQDVENISREFPRPEAAVADFRLPMLAPEVHRSLKSLSQPVLTPQRVNTRRKEVEAIADRLIAQMRTKVAAPDLFSDYARPFVGEAMMLFLGIPAEKADALFQVAALMPLGIPIEQLDTDHEALIAEMFAGYNAILAEVYDKPAPAGSLIAALQAAEAEEKMTRGQTQDTLACSLDGGLTSVLHFVRGMLHYFACYPEKWDNATRGAENIPAVVEEMMRFLSPASVILWGNALHDTTIGGCPMTRGDRVEFDIYQANRDPEVFSSPDEVIFDRPEKQHLALGHGPHFCLGAAMARLVGQVAIERLAAGWGKLGLAQKVAPASTDKAWGYIPELIIKQHNEAHATGASSRSL